MHRVAVFVLAVFCLLPSRAITAETRPIILKSARVFDGVNRQPHEGWVVVVRGEKIDSAGPTEDVKVPNDARVIELPATCPLDTNGPLSSLSSN